MITTEHRYPAFEAAFFVRLYCGDIFNWYAAMSDIRRGRKVRLPNIRHRSHAGAPYYTSSDLMTFVEEVRRMYPEARSGIRPQYEQYDIEKEMSL